MKREAHLLLAKGLDSLVLAVERLNGPSNRGRVTSVLIFTDHAFEMLLKAAILHRGAEFESCENGRHWALTSVFGKG